jgi:putative membrane protein
VVFVLAYMLQISVVFLIYNRWGIAVSGNYVVVRKGIVGIDYIVLPAFKMQRVALHETPLTKRRGLSSISFLVASRSVKVPFIDSQLARDVLNYCAYQVESRKRSWM